MKGDPRRDIVIHLQTALVALGSTIEPDGILGDATMGAVIKFQKSNIDFKSVQ